MSDEKTIMPNEMKAARAVLDYLINFPALDGPDEQHYCAGVIAEHTRHEGKTALQWADECRSYQRNLADAQADIAGEVEHSKELATRITELEALASRLKEQRDMAAEKEPDWEALKLALNNAVWMHAPGTTTLAQVEEATCQAISYLAKCRNAANIPDNTQ
jgi:predicted RNase H-like nuclease (RuvC/YqgF family)